MKKYVTILATFCSPIKVFVTSTSWRNPRKVFEKIYQHFAQDSLYRNSIYLVLSTMVLSFFGFFFWYINAKLFSPKDIGYATAIISIASLLSSLSILGLDNALVKYLPKSKDKNNQISVAIAVISLASFILTLLYLSNLQLLSPKLLFLKQTIGYAAAFVLFVTLSAINNITNSIFIAYRSSKYVLITNLIFSLVKITLPVFVISLGATGIYLTILISVLISLIASVWILVKKFGYRVNFNSHQEIIKGMYKFSLGTYLSGVVGGLPSQLLPIIIINKLRPEISAYFYIDMMIIGLLYIIPISATQAFFSESSFSEEKVRENIIKVIRILIILVIPAIVLTLIGGKYVLALLGKSYSTEGIGFLRLMSFSTIVVSVNYVLGTLFKIRNQIKAINMVTVISSLVTLVVSYLLAPQGLYGIGIGLITGQLTTMVAYFICSLKRSK